jgi:sugar phosphate isomerase/epimerase
MKTSASLFFTDILPHKRKFYHKIVKSKLFDHFTPQHVFVKLKSAGVDGVELILPSFLKVSDQDLYEVKKVLDENNMPIFSVHQVIRFITKTRLDEINELFHIAELLGAKIIVLHMNSAGKQVLDKEYVKQIHILQQKYNIQVGFENREKFVGSLHSGYGWHSEKFANLMNNNNFQITFDTTHLAHSGGDIVSFFEKNKARIVNIHLSDYKPNWLNGSLRPMRYKHLPLGKGTLPMKAFLEVLKKEHYNGILTMEINANLDGLFESAKIIQSILKKDS